MWDQRISTASPSTSSMSSRASDAEEIVIVGHSSGSFLGTEMLARALKRFSSIRHSAVTGRDIVLLTIGGNFPIVGFSMSASQDFRDHLRLLAVEPQRTTGSHCQARKDVMNFYQFDPIKKPRHRRRLSQTQSGRSVAVRFRDIVRSDHYETFLLAVLPGPFPVRDGQRNNPTPTTSSWRSSAGRSP